MVQISEILACLRARDIQFTFSGDETLAVDGFSSLTNYKPGSFTWIKTQINIPEDFDTSVITLAFISNGIIGGFRNVICTPNSKRAFFAVIEHFYAPKEERAGIGQFTYLSPNVKLGKNVCIGHNCTLDGDITIGDNTVIWNGVTLVNRIEIGANCDIRSGVIIGHDGLGYTEDESHKKTMIQHFGGVWIGDDVLIGENTCISRGTIDDTVIESGVKIDSLCHVAHNCRVGKNSTLAAPCRLNGSVSVGENCFIAGGLVRNQRSIGNHAFIGLGAVVTADVQAGQIVAGVPAKPFIKSKT